MFSIGESQRSNAFPSSYLRIGIAPTSFDYTGNFVGTSDPTLLEIENSALHVNLETPGVSLSLILANKLTGLDDRSFFDLGFSLGNNFFLVRERVVSLGIPIQLYTSITNANNEQNQENFNQVNFAVGGGGFLNFRISPKIVFNNEFIPGYGFSNSSGGFFGGSMFYAKGKSRLNFLNLIGQRSISLGYDFNFRSFDIDDEFYDFDLTSHQITLGISL